MRGNMNEKTSLKCFVRKNIHWIVFGCFVVLMLVLHRFVLLTGDDYMHSSVIGEGASSFWSWHAHHFLRKNGRAVIHFLLTLAFALPNAEIQRILNPFVIAFVLLLEAKLCSEEKVKMQRSFLFLCLIFLGLFGEFMSMGIYSFSPAFNYVHPMLLTYGAALCTRRVYAGKPVGKAFYAMYWLVCLFAGASMEQSGIMAIGYLVLTALVAYLQQKKKPPETVQIALIITVAGYLTVMLAPGNSVRMATSTKPFSENCIAAATMLLNTRSFVLFHLVFVFCIVFWLLRLRPANKLLSALHICMCIGMIVGNLTNLFLLFNPFGISLESSGLVGLLWRGYDLLYIFCTVYVPLWIAYQKKDWSYAVHMCIALGSVFILLFASISPYRPLIPAVLTMMIFMAKTLLEATQNVRARNVVLAALSVMAAFSFALNLRGYVLNYAADRENRQRIAQYLADEERGGELRLRPYADEMTAGYSVCAPGAVYTPEDAETVMYVSRYKSFSGIPKETTLVFDPE